MKNEGWEKQQVRRASYRAALRSDAGEAQNDRAFAECQRILEQEKEAHRLLAASLYRYGRFLFLYTEGIGETAVPEKLFAPAVPLLQKWPVTIEEPDNDRVWVLMQPYYYHAIPESMDAEQTAVPAAGPDCAACAGQVGKLYDASSCADAGRADRRRPVSFDQYS